MWPSWVITSLFLGLGYFRALPARSRSHTGALLVYATLVVVSQGVSDLVPVSYSAIDLGPGVALRRPCAHARRFHFRRDLPAIAGLVGVSLSLLAPTRVQMRPSLPQARRRSRLAGCVSGCGVAVR